MKLCVIYDSKTGNTRQAAEWIAEGMCSALAEGRAFPLRSWTRSSCANRKAR